MNIVLLEETSVKIRFVCLLAAVLIALMGLNVACAQGAISTTVTMRVSHLTQSAVVKAGEDLTIEVNIDGVTPDSFQWFYQDRPIDGANQKVLNIVNARPADSGLYRLDAYDGNGALVVSMDIAARVVEDVVPQAGDDSLPVGAAMGGMALCGAALAVLLRRRAMV